MTTTKVEVGGVSVEMTPLWNEEFCRQMLLIRRYSLVLCSQIKTISHHKFVCTSASYIYMLGSTDR